MAMERQQNPFDTPVPGQSLTDTPGNYPWEHAPKTASIEEATDFVYEAMMKPENMERMFKQAYKFNQDISSWNVSNVKNMYTMFIYTKSDKL